MELRGYQEDAIAALFDWFQTRDGDPLCVLPTGSGKSAVLSAFLARARFNYPALRATILVTRAELVKQNARTAALFLPAQDIGIYSASLQIKQTDKPFTVANIQSLAKKVYGFDAPDIVICDEAQEIADHDAGLYRQYFKAVRQQNPNAKIVGLTATPYKLSSGRLDEGPNALFAGVAYEAPVLDLIQNGYLCRPVTPRSRLQLDTANVPTRGDFVLKALADAVDVSAITDAAADEMCERFAERKKWLVFTCTIDHARHVAEALSTRGISAGVVHGELSKDERAHRLAAFSTGEIKALCNAQLLTVGYDEPAVDAIALLRPTKSPGFYAQMLGRGMRIHPSKTDCLVLDFGGNIELHGPIDALRVKDKKASKEQGDAVVKVCPGCECYVAAGCRNCPECGFEFPPPPVVLNASASTAAILSVDAEPEWHDVTEVRYTRHPAKPPKVTDTLKAQYYAGFRPIASEWVCIEHDGFARRKAEGWFAERVAESCPQSIDDAIALLEADSRPVRRIGLLPDPANPKYQRITRIEYADAPIARKHESTLPRACWSCLHWDALMKHCEYWHAVPPSDVQQTGCEAWSDDEPELPF